MLQCNFNHKQKCNKKKEPNEDLITSFINFLVECLVFSVGEVSSNNECHKK